MSAGEPSAGFAPLPEFSAAPESPAGFAAEARRIHAQSVRYWAAYDTPTFFRRPAPAVWGPADQVRHLTKVIRAITGGLRLPRLLLLLRFGWSRRSSRSLEAVRAAYDAALARGGQAGRFAPRPLAGHEATEEGRARLMGAHAAAVEAFVDAITRWAAPALDRYRLPHPLIGTITVREMALFTLLHNVHHVEVAERRRRELASALAGDREAAT